MASFWEKTKAAASSAADSSGRAAKRTKLNADIALLQRNGAVWREDMRLAREWVERYFDTRARQTDNALATLRQLASVDPGEGLPGLNESMSALAQLKAQRQRPTVQREEKR